jgi:hypothetical protein
MCDFASKGIHAVSFNGSSIGIEVLGYYDTGKEDPKTGRGLACWQNAAATVRVLLDWLNLQASPSTIKFHRDDPQTTKTCPGSAVDKNWFLSLIPQQLPALTTSAPASQPPNVGFPWNTWHFTGERWCVPIVDFLVAKGVPRAQAIANLTSMGGMLFYKGDLIHGGFYVRKGESPKPDETSWAPAREVLEMA